MERCVVGIRRSGELEAAAGSEYTPTVWFPSMATMAAVLSEDNRALLRTIHQQQPGSITELSEITGRQVPNLSRTLRMMEGYGLVTLTRKVRKTRPTARVTEFLIVLD